jgi:hypothetical protein
VDAWSPAFGTVARGGDVSGVGMNRQGIFSSGLQQSRIIPNYPESGRIRSFIGLFLNDEYCKPARFWFATL